MNAVAEQHHHTSFLPGQASQQTQRQVVTSVRLNHIVTSRVQPTRFPLVSFGLLLLP
jgi:hypothetical protein